MKQVSVNVFGDFMLDEITMRGQSLFINSQLSKRGNTAQYHHYFHPNWCHLQGLTSTLQLYNTLCIPHTYTEYNHIQIDFIPHHLAI